MTVTSLEPRLASAVTELWQDKGMQEAYSRRNEFYISDSAGYFMSNVSRFVDNDYLPTQGRKEGRNDGRPPCPDRFRFCVRSGAQTIDPHVSPTPDRLYLSLSTASGGHPARENAHHRHSGVLLPHTTNQLPPGRRRRPGRDTIRSNLHCNFRQLLLKFTRNFAAQNFLY